MTYDVLATDYDGTIAFDGRVTDDTLTSLRKARDSGIQLIMVTGRELADLFNTFAHPDIFDRIVAENGAVLYEPGTKAVRVLAPGPPTNLIERLTREKVPLSVGHCIVATVEPYERNVETAIHDLGLDWHVIFNKGSVMALPSEVTKAAGLAEALDAAGTSWARTVGIGDAENDLAFLRRCGVAVAVDNALPSVKAMVDWVTAGARGAGVSELIERWLQDDLDALSPNPARTPAAATFRA
jgi:hydroxymethylpyrimidine pyrophosphatase-like HAD family hydrolase